MVLEVKIWAWRVLFTVGLSFPVGRQLMEREDACVGVGVTVHVCECVHVCV